MVRYLLSHLHVLPVPPVHLRPLPHWTRRNLRRVHTPIHTVPRCHTRQRDAGITFLILNSKKFGYKIFLAWIFSRVSLFVSKSIALSGQVPQVPAKLLEGLVVPARVSALTGSV